MDVMNSQGDRMSPEVQEYDDLAPIVNQFPLIELNYGEFRIDSLAEVS